MQCFLSRATLAVALASAVTGAAAAAPTVPGIAPLPIKLTGPTAMVKGQISAPAGVKLNCANVNVEFHDPKGNVVSVTKTTVTKTGACAYNTAVPANIELSACPSLFIKQSLDQPAFVPASAKVFDTKLAREAIGTMGAIHLYSNVVKLNALPAGANGSTDELRLSQER